MDSYSVNEAAAVLGIPEGRVWELLARGVLAGSTEVGGDMRVILRGAPLPDAASAAAPNGSGHDANAGNGGNGGNGHGHGEPTQFRELLTEFRNLTERYGQALLALGESRGEVAALRGRVDLLEARIEHRLPWTEAPPAGWNAEALPEPEATDGPIAEAMDQPAIDEAEDDSAIAEGSDQPATAEAADEPAMAESAIDEPARDEIATEEATENETVFDSADAEPPSEMADADGARPPDDHDDDLRDEVDDLPSDAQSPDSELPDLADEEPSSSAKPAKGHTRSRSREAVLGFAEALARAEDPTTASVGDEGPLPGTQDIANAMAAYRREVDSDDDMDGTGARPSDEGVPIAGDTEAEEASPIVRAGYSTATPEPDWIAEEDLLVVAAPTDDQLTDADDPPRPDEEVPDAEPVASVAVPAWPELPVEEPVEETRDEAQSATVIDSVAEVMTDPAPSVLPESVFDAIPDPDSDVIAEPVAEPADEPAAEAPAAANGEWGIAAPEEPSTDLMSHPWSEVPLEPVAVARAEPIAIGEPAHELTSRTPIEIAAEPPAADDVALLVGPAAFSEPPQIPREPAFWEAGARARAPFAIPHMGAWDASSTDAVTVATEPETAAAIAAPPVPAVTTPLSTPPDSEVAWGVAPVSEPPVSEPPVSEPVTPPPTPASSSLLGQAPAPIRPARTSRPRRGATARAIRRLRLLLD